MPRANRRKVYSIGDINVFQVSQWGSHTPANRLGYSYYICRCPSKLPDIHGHFFLDRYLLLDGTWGRSCALGWRTNKTDAIAAARTAARA